MDITLTIPDASFTVLDTYFKDLDPARYPSGFKSWVMEWICVGTKDIISQRVDTEEVRTIRETIRAKEAELNNLLARTVEVK